METVKTGSVVMPLKGRDAGRAMMVLGISGNYAFIADGRHRKISAPKKKNLCHLRILCEDTELCGDTLTDGKLRRLLS